MRTIEFTGTISDPTMESFNFSALSTGYLTSVSDATANGQQSQAAHALIITLTTLTTSFFIFKQSPERKTQI
jgi:hypothetical protein